MLSSMLKRVSYTNIVLTLALVFAMTGGAYAASKYLITSTKQISPKVIKSLQGKAGRVGTKGATGPDGPAGKEGPPGKEGTPGKEGGPGKEGTPGKDGNAGANGESVASTPLAAKNANCTEGGSEFTAGGKHTYACNGSPWVAGGVLPSGKSEFGQWSEFRGVVANELEYLSISFPIPLGSGVTPHFIGPGEGENEPEAKWAIAIKEGKCKGDVAQPLAASGNLCVFANIMQLVAFAVFWNAAEVEPTEAAGPTGTTMLLSVTQATKAGEMAGGLGTWAVTAK